MSDRDEARARRALSVRAGIMTASRRKLTADSLEALVIDHAKRVDILSAALKDKVQQLASVEEERDRLRGLLRTGLDVAKSAEHSGSDAGIVEDWIAAAERETGGDPK